MRSTTNCPICEDGMLVPDFYKNGYEIDKCPHCNILTVIGQFELSDFESVYGTSYYKNDKPRYFQNKLKNNQTWIRRINLIDKHKTTSGNKLLDVGCGTGIFLSVAKSKGWDVQGIEISEAGRLEASKRIGDGRILSDFFVLDDTENFDVITMWAVLEHLIDPKSYIRKAHLLLKQNGLLVIATVNTASFNHRIFGKNWRYFTPPEHLVYFNVKNLLNLLRVSDFEELHAVTRYNNLAFWQGLGLQKLFKRYGVFRKSQTILLYPISVISRATMCGDIIELVAKRI